MMHKTNRYLLFSALALVLLMTPACHSIQSNTDTSSSTRDYPAIVVYGNPMCPHCRSFTGHLQDQNIPYTFLDIAANNQYRQDLWQLIKKHHPETKSVALPVVETKGKVFIRPDWNQFMRFVNE